jgi:hypothetical protein
MPERSRAVAVNAPVDFGAAERLLDQAEKHLRSARAAGVDDESRYGILYDGARKAADAVLRASGRRLTHGTGHHAQYIAEAKRLLGSPHEFLLVRLEAARRVRNDVQYQTREVTEIELRDLEDAARRIVAAARQYVTEAVRDSPGRTG